MTLKIYQVDAFTKKIFGGNPAAVIPLNEWIDDELMQHIATENNLSETVFFVNSGSGFHIRWFTPEGEIDLCGHATLAAAYVIKNYIDKAVGTIQFTTQQVGVVRTICSDDKYTLDFPSRMPVAVKPHDSLLKSLGITDPVKVLKSRDYFVVLPDEEAVRKVTPDFTLMRQVDAVGIIITARGDSADVVSRCFYPSMGVPEDPVTGSAHCNIIPYWCNELGRNSFFAKQLSPRGGDIWCEQVNDRVMITGYCAEFMKGDIFL